MTVSFGADPELFFKDSRTGIAMPMVGLVGGTKARPLQLPNHPAGYCVQEDNVMVEYNVPVTHLPEDFAQTIVRGLSAVEDFVRTRYEHLTPEVGVCSRLFTTEALDNQQARVFGCSPDFDAHRQGAALPPPNAELLAESDGEWRFAGGHVHIGYERTEEFPHYVAGAFADVFLGLPAVALDQQGTRRTLYGSAGRYRPTGYGIEYRTLSNFWIWSESLALSLGRKANALGHYLESYDLQILQRHYQEIPWHDVRAAITNEDANMAADLLAYITADLQLREAA